MARIPHSHGSPRETHRLDSLGRVKRQRLRHIFPPSHQQQAVLIQTTRAARRAKQRRRFCAVEPSLRDQMLGLLPNLRAFALSLTYDPTWADDLVQDTILRAYSKIDRFERGTSLGAWLFTILRNGFYTQHRKRRYEVEDPDGTFVGRLSVMPAQESRLEAAEARRALARLPVKQREALLLVGAEGLSYEEAALIQGVSIGTVKSRVHRARSQLADLLQIEDWHEIGPDRVLRAALQEPAAPFHR
jgi:RNA polymerase sigma-70 factor, ECF subfamily